MSRKNDKNKYTVTDHEGREVAVIDKKDFELFLRTLGADSREAFFSELICGGLSNQAIAARSAELKLDTELKRRIYLIKLKNPAQLAASMEIIGQIFADSEEDISFENAADEIVLISAIKGRKDISTPSDRADLIVSMINTELMEELRVSYSKAFDELSAAPAAYMQARVSMEIGHLFYDDRLVCGYDELGLGRLVYGLSAEDCEEFMEEHFGEKKKLRLSEEELAMAGRFLEKGLNLSETARDLFMHRNTLVYHLEKIQKKTGLDVRKFEDAVIFKIALMIERRLG
ncbi:MAG: helix-turn-helix domain-containing protein [Lachnospiraceae bacterium]|nr:helix-turn-helix domain-containing protein [Lachnospiraceae bacterium]